MAEPTKVQKEILKEVLEGWLENESEILNDAFNYEITRREFNVRFTQMVNVAIILEQVVGVEGRVLTLHEEWPLDRRESRMENLQP